MIVSLELDGYPLYIYSMQSKQAGSRKIAGTERNDPAEIARPLRKGRGTVWAIQHRFSGQTSEVYDDGWVSGGAEREKKLVLVAGKMA